MRKAAAIIMLVFGVFIITGVLLILLPAESGASVARILLPLAVAVLAIVAGIGVLRRRAYWWALLAAIGMIVTGVSNAGWVFEDPIFGRLDTATQVLLAARAWAIWGVPGLVALIFLLKRKGGFEGTEAKKAATRDE